MGTFKQTAAQRSKRFGKVHLNPLDGTVQKVWTVQKCTSDYNDSKHKSSVSHESRGTGL